MFFSEFFYGTGTQLLSVTSSSFSAQQSSTYVFLQKQTVSKAVAQCRYTMYMTRFLQVDESLGRPKNAGVA